MISNEFKFIEEHSHGEKSETENMIIRGENRAVLKSLANFFGKVKCIYIDPPYNNGEDYYHYNDNSLHDHWIKEMVETLTILKHFLTQDGSIWISIDDKEMHYLKVAADSVFGRRNFISTIVWQQRSTRENRTIFSNNHEYILVYAIDPLEFKKSRNPIPLTESVLNRYKNPDNDPRGPWQSVSLNVQNGHAVNSQYYTIVAPNGKQHVAPNGRCWAYNEERMKEEIKNNNVWFGWDGNGVPRAKKFLLDNNKGLTPETLWLSEFAGSNKIAKKHLKQLFPNERLFDTPKPEQLIQQILNVTTNKGDIVLDCYLGSGSTISTAHKMGRRYIGIEIGNHIVDLVVQRMRAVVAGEKGGISKSIGWKGGGSFSFYEFQPKSKPRKKKKSKYSESVTPTVSLDKTNK